MLAPPWSMGTIQDLEMTKIHSYANVRAVLRALLNNLPGVGHGGDIFIHALLHRASGINGGLGMEPW